MTEVDDIELLRRFAVENSEDAFAAIVGRHVNLVYSVALRQVGNSHSAEEITQAVFIILARKAKSFSRKTILTGWLHQTTRLTAANYLRTEIRRQRREQEAFMQSTLSETETWTQISWNTDNGWLWRHKTAMFAARHGLKDLGQMKKFFGRRWAYRLQKRIVGEYLEGVVFPSRKAGEINLTQGFPTFLERVRKKEIQEAIAILETLVVHPSNN